MEAYNKALSLKPDYAEAYNNMGIILKDQGKLEEAMETYNKVLSLKPDYAEAWSNGAEALEKWNKLKNLVSGWKERIKSLTIPSDISFMKSKLLLEIRIHSQLSNSFRILMSKLLSQFDNKITLIKSKCYEALKDYDSAFDCFKVIIHLQSNLVIQGLILKVIFKISASNASLKSTSLDNPVNAS